MRVAQTLTLAVTNGSIYALLALGVVLVYRGSRVLTFALGEIGTSSLFIAWLLIEQWHVPYAIGAVLAIGYAVALGVVFERLVVSRLGAAPRVTVSIATVGLFLFILSFELYFGAGNIYVLRPPIHGRGINIAGYQVSPTDILSVGVVVALAAGLTALLRRTDFGLGVLASADDPEAVRLVGVPLWKVSAFTWGAGAGLAAVAALLIEPHLTEFAPGYVSARIYIFALAAALVGGLSSLEGAFVGGFIVALVQSVAQQVHIEQVHGLETDVVVALVLVVLLTRPQGLLGKALR